MTFFLCFCFCSFVYFWFLPFKFYFLGGGCTLPQLSFLIVKVVDFFAVNSPVIKILRKLIKFLEIERENFNPGNAPIKRSGQSVTLVNFL